MSVSAEESGVADIINYEQLARAVLQADPDTHGVVDRLNAELTAAYEEQDRLRGEVAVVTTRAADLERKNEELREKLRQKRQERIATKDINEMVTIAQRTEGWDVARNGRNHWKFTSPSGETVVAPSTPSDHRSALNVRSDLRRAGLEV